MPPNRGSVVRELSRRALLLEKVRHIGVPVDAEEIEPKDAESVPLPKRTKKN